MRIGKRKRVSLAAVTHRLKAVVASIDEELAYLDGILSSPMTDIVLSPEQWAAAEGTRAELEQSVRSLEDAVAETARQASDWRRRAALAEQEHRADMAATARKRAATADAEHRAYVEEVTAARQFLEEWDSRVKPAAAG